MLAGLRTLDPEAARAGSIGTIDLRHDALGPKPAGVREDDRAVRSDRKRRGGWRRGWAEHAGQVARVSGRLAASAGAAATVADQVRATTQSKNRLSAGCERTDPPAFTPRGLFRRNESWHELTGA